MADKIDIHIDASEKRAELPDAGLDSCPHCSGPLEDGFGLAGGGFGIYQFCAACGRIVSKTLVEE